MDGFSEKDVVGVYIKATLVNGTVVEGNVFTCNAKEGVIVVVAPTGNNKTFGNACRLKIIRTPFIETFEIIPEETEGLCQLPESVGAYVSLPSMADSEKSVFKHVSQKLKNSEESRKHELSDMKDTPIAACTTFLKVRRIYPQLTWDDENSAIQDKYAVIVGEPDWRNPTVKVKEGVVNAKDAEDSLRRLQSTLEKV